MAAASLDSDQYPMDSADLRALMDACMDAIVVIDDGGKITSFNAGAERLFGYKAADVIGKGVELLMPEPHRSNHDGYIKRYLATGKARIIGVGREAQGKHADGTVFPVGLSVGEARSGDRRRFVGILRDLSQQREAEKRTRSLEGRLAHVGRFNLMGEMAAGIAHEINQPLSAIATYAQAGSRMLGQETIDVAVLQEICTKVDEQARRAGQVIENLRKFIRKQEIETRPLDMNSLVCDVLNLIEADARAEGIRVDMQLGRDLPQVNGDPIQLQQVLLNLTRNAVDAMRGGLHKERGISITTEKTEDGVRVSVTDFGHGVSRQLGDNIFHPFVTTKREGLGVGLAISRTIVQSYGGTLTYHDNPQGGAIFVVELPAQLVGRGVGP